MKSFSSALLVVILMVSFTSLASSSYAPIAVDNLTLSKSIEKSHVVVIGEVVYLKSVRRANVLPEGKGAITTDVTVKIDELIKGKANLGTKHVRFAILGGTEFSVVHDGMVTLSVTGVPTFELGEKMMLFLVDNSDSDYYANWPYNGLHTYIGEFGKHLIENDKVRFAYPRNDKVGRAVKFPIDLASTLAIALVKDKDSALVLEAEIKDLVRNFPDTPEWVITLTDSFASKLQQQAQAIIDNSKSVKKTDSHKIQNPKK